MKQQSSFYSFYSLLMVFILSSLSFSISAQCLICSDGTVKQCIQSVQNQFASDSTCQANFGADFTVFQHSQSNCADIPDCDGATLPVDLASFRVSQNQSSILIEWTTAAEIGNKGFEIERNTGSGWQVIGFVAGEGSTNILTTYSFQDRNPVLGINYYRLKQIDFDGKFDLSNVRSVNFKGDSQVSLFPNPASDLITVSNAFSEPLTAYLFNSLGQEIDRYELDVGQNQINIQLLPSGWYTLKIYQTEVHTSSLRFVK